MGFFVCIASAAKRANGFASLLAVCIVILVSSFVQGQTAIEQNGTLAAATEQQKLDFFERKIRPLLIDHCLECHSVDTEASGGLLLDSKQGIERGGDSGPAIDRDKLESSRLLEAIEYRNPHLQMPPNGALPKDAIDDLKQWILSGAYDPRQVDTSTMPALAKQKGLSVERAMDHWAYKPLVTVAPPTVSLENDDRSPDKSLSGLNPIDAFLNARMRELEVTESDLIDEHQFRRRLYLDLLGVIPNGPFESRRGSDVGHDGFDFNDQRRNAIADELLSSPLFGERMARHWMDVIRFSESITLRGFVLPEAWQYRNYLIDSFNQDRPFDLMIEEHIAGDLMEYADLNDRQRGVIATMALQLGDTNLEEQDKLQLEMDFVDEQLDTLGKAFLGQTLGCARCHDHKFDPIPTRDYYALAGILKSSIPIEHSNVSNLVRRSLPLDTKQEENYAALAQELREAQSALSLLKKQKPTNKLAQKILKREDVRGVLVDDAEAKKIGAWQSSSFVPSYVGDGYVHDKNESPGEKSITFEPSFLEPGEYMVRLAYSAGENRCSKTEVRVFSANGEKVIHLNQRAMPSDDGLWQSLGTFRFEAGGQAFVLISNAGADGFVMADAIQFIREEDLKTQIANADKQSSDSLGNEKKQIEELETLIKSLEARQSLRPKVISFRDAKTFGDIPVHVRGSVHTLGAVVPRGFLQCVPANDAAIQISEKESGRLELGRWLTGPARHLTARVYVNRVWAWLMGEGIVPSVDNFGTTGDTPVNPELLEWLSEQFVVHEWSTKWLVKTIVTSDAYRRSVVAAGDAANRDPSNHCFARANLRRLDAEALRDSMLAASGELQLVSQIGSTIRPNTNEDYRYSHEVKFRTIYGPWFRNSPVELYPEFDGANPSVPVGQRNRSTVATQSLALMNSDWVHQRVRATTKRILDSEAADIVTQIQSCFLRVYGREPYANEMDWFLSRDSVRSKATAGELLSESEIEQVIHMMFASLAFRFVE